MAKAVHIQDEQFPTESLCRQSWFHIAPKGGRVASDTTPPVVVDEAGSVNAATCKTCLAIWRKRRT